MSTVLKKGVFIVFEGIDGSGKTTALEKVAERLAARGYKVVKTGIGGDPFSDAILSTLKDSVSADTDHTTQALLINAIRRHNLKTVVAPALEDGCIVLCDRYVLSTRYYQKDCKTITQLHMDYCNFCEPDLTIVINVAPEEAEERLNRRGGRDRFDNASVETKLAYREIILKWLYNNAARSTSVCGTAPSEVVADRIESKILEKVFAKTVAA